MNDASNDLLQTDHCNDEKAASRLKARLKKQNQRAAAPKIPLSEQRKDANRKACVKYRESLSSGSDTDKQNNRTLAKHRQAHHRESASESEKETTKLKDKIEHRKQRVLKKPTTEQETTLLRARVFKHRQLGLQRKSNASSGSDLDEEQSQRVRRPRTLHKCRFCNQEGHMQPLSIHSCPNFCTYCNMIAHNVKDCKSEKADTIKAGKMNRDAKNYQVSHNLDVNVKFPLIYTLFVKRMPWSKQWFSTLAQYVRLSTAST